MRESESKEMKTTEAQTRDIINKQFYYCDKPFDVASKDLNWRKKNTLSVNEHNEWLEWCVNYLMIENDINKREAEMAASWFELKWGLTIDNAKR